MHPIFGDYSIADANLALHRMTEEETSFEPGMRALFVHRHDLVRELLGSDALQNARLADPLMAELPPEKYRLHQPIKHFFSLWPVFSHGTYHQRVRAAVRSALSRESTVSVVSAMRPSCDDLLSGLAGPAGVDWVDEFARPYAVALLAQLFGVPVTTFSELLGPTDRVMTYLSKPLSLHDDELAVETLSALAAITAVVRDEILAQPRTPLAQAVAHLAADVESGAEVAAAVTTQIITGTLDPLVTLLTDTLILLEGRKSTASVAELAEESLRLSCPIRFAPRHVNRRLVVDGRQLDRGDRVILGLATANLDPHRHTDPLEFRPERDETPHLSFGLGSHYCLGAPLARWAAEELVRALTGGALSVTVDASSLVRDKHLSISKVMALRILVASTKDDHGHEVVARG
jgi:cytochrome P450